MFMMPSSDISPAHSFSGRNKVGLYLLGLGTLLIYLAFLPPVIFDVDGNAMLAVSVSLLHGSVQVPTSDLGIHGRNGALYSGWYPLQSFAALPFVALGSALAHLLHLPVHNLEAVCALLLVALCTAGTVPLVSFLALQLGADQPSAYLAGVVYGFGTIALVYARGFFADPLLALLTTSALCFAFQQRATPAAALCLFSVLAKPVGVVVGPVLSAYLFARTRKLWVSAIPAIGSALGLGLYAIYNAYRFGHPLTFGPPMSFAVRYIPEGLTGLLVSPGFGLLWFSPCAVCGLVGIFRAHKRWEAFTILGIFGSFLGVHSLWVMWWGGWSWGPRLILPALPGVVASIALLPNWAKKVTAALALVTFLLTAPTMFSYWERCYNEADWRGTTLSEIMWNPVASPLIHAWPVAFRETRDAIARAEVPLMADSPSIPWRDQSFRALQMVAIWWWLLPLAHVPRAFGAALSLLLVIAGATALKKASDWHLHGTP